MRPFLLLGHSRPVTRVRYNPDGDLLISTAKDKPVNVWSAVDGRLMSSYNGHTAMVWDLDIDPLSRVCLSGAADSTAQLWCLNTGTLLRTFSVQSSVRSVAISPSAKLALMVVENRAECKSSVLVVPLDIEHALATSRAAIADAAAGKDPPVSVAPDEQPLAVLFPGAELTPVIVARWANDSSTIYFGHENGMVSCWDARTERMIAVRQIATRCISDLQFSLDRSFFIVSSWDKTAHLVTLDLEVFKTYKTETPVNSAAVCPLRKHVILCGGQEAGMVTTTAARAGNFESRFYHMILEQEIGRVPGHFGPVNSVAVHPDNLSFATGGEDGNVRLQHFDPDYFTFALDPQDLEDN